MGRIAAIAMTIGVAVIGYSEAPAVADPYQPRSVHWNQANCVNRGREGLRTGEFIAFYCKGLWYRSSHFFALRVYYG